MLHGQSGHVWPDSTIRYKFRDTLPIVGVCGNRISTNLTKHGFDFAKSKHVFSGPTITVEDSRDYYGEQRFNTTGFLGTTIVTISHTETKDEIHVFFNAKGRTL